MSADPSPDLLPELLDDFYAECDELLTRTREILTACEAGEARTAAGEALATGLFRAVHTLKGSAAIVGLRPAEELAHAIEDVLRPVSNQAAALEPALVEKLMLAVQRFDQIIVAHRRHQELPGIQDLLTRLQRPAASAVEAPRQPAGEPRAATAGTEPAESIRARGLQPWSASFAPTAELNARGVNIDAVRQRLAAAGEIIRVTPVVRGMGGIVFDFLMAFREAPTELGAWKRDGIELSPIGAAPPPGVESAADALAFASSPLVRVDLARLDDMMRLAGEMVILRSRLDDRLAQSGDTGDLRDINLGLGRSLRHLRDLIARVRLVPVAEIFSRMPFVVRDLMLHAPKQARVVLEGHQTEIDKHLVERLKEPLLHLVRNAFSHGIETPAARLAAGKPAEGTIVLRATQAGEFVVIKIRDDGAGVDVDAVAAQARAKGLSVPATLDADAVLKLLCAPGFSTRDEADFAAGRGIGMSVVANTVRELGGTLLLESTRGHGTEFTLRLPLMLSITPAIVVSVGDQGCAVPQGFVEEILQVPAGDVRTIQRTEVVPYRGGLLPLVRLRAVFGQAPATDSMLTLVVLNSERGATGLLVDRVRTQREVVVRPLTDPLLRVPYISGATELGDGRPLLVLDPVAVTSGVVRPAFDRAVPTDPTLAESRPS